MTDTWEDVRRAEETLTFEMKTREVLEVSREIRWALEDARRSGNSYRAYLWEKIVERFHEQFGKETWQELGTLL